MSEELLDEEIIYDLADLFKVFSDSTRIRILVALFEGELCVGDIAQRLEISQTAISHQLRILKQNHLIKYRRNGKSMIYSLADEHVKTIIDCATEHVEE
ncbi:MAG: winged helix-turn-helix transcriptional regulator [Eubacterium sp.]|nr:winged helix-turn-helix transcriptional regulator [Eubacterium sp.]